MALANFMRLSLMKAAHADVGDAAWQEIRVAHLFRPTYAPRHAGAGVANGAPVRFPPIFSYGTEFGGSVSSPHMDCGKAEVMACRTAAASCSRVANWCG